MSSHESTAPETSELDYEPAEQEDEWMDGQPEELPRRPRRRLLTPVPLTLLIALLVACGFIGGVLVQKGQGDMGSASAGASSAGAARFAALKGAGPGAGSAVGGARSAGGSASRGSAGGFPGLGGSTGGGVTSGEVAYVRGDTLYVTDSQGNTVKVTASAAAKVTKTVSTKAQSIHPGSTVVVLGSKAKNGAISATSITVDSAASAGATGPATNSSSGGTGAGPTTLFGPG